MPCLDITPLNGKGILSSSRRKLQMRDCECFRQAAPRVSHRHVRRRRHHGLNSESTASCACESVADLQCIDNVLAPGVDGARRSAYDGESQQQQREGAHHCGKLFAECVQGLKYDVQKRDAMLRTCASAGETGVFCCPGLTWSEVNRTHVIRWIFPRAAYPPPFRQSTNLTTNLMSAKSFYAARHNDTLKCY